MGWLQQPPPLSHISLSFCRMSLLSHHNLLLEILSSACKRLIHSMVLIVEYAEETNQKQKIRKLQNENICLTNLNVESLCKPRVELNLFELYRGAAKFG